MSSFFSDWMSKIDGNKKISQLTIPGTHDSMTYLITKGLIKGLPNGALTGLVTYLSSGFSFLIGWLPEVIFRCANCQTLTLEEQLEAGVRFFDIRLRKEGKKLEAFHGIRLHMNFVEIQDIFIRFLSNHSNETIIVSVKNDDKGRQNTEDIYSILWDDIITNAAYNSYWYTQDKIPALKDVRGKMVLMRRFYSKLQPFSVGIDAFVGWPDNKHNEINNACKINIQDKFSSFLLGKQDHKFKDHVKPQLERAMNDGSSDKLYINFTSGTGGVYPRTLATGYMSQFEGTNSLLEKFLVNRGKHRFGIIAMDFPEYPNSKNLIHQLILSNDFNHSVTALTDKTVYEIRNGQGVDSCLDVWLDEKQNGSEVKISKAHGRDNQAWEFTLLRQDAQGSYGCFSPMSIPPLALEAKDNATPSVIVSNKISNNNAQQWLLHFNAEGYFMLKPQSASTKTLDVSYLDNAGWGNLSLSVNNNGAAAKSSQQWTLQPFYYKDHARALYLYKLKSSDTYCLSFLNVPFYAHPDAGISENEGMIGYIMEKQTTGTIPLYEHLGTGGIFYSLERYFFGPFLPLREPVIIGYVFPPHDRDLNSNEANLYNWGMNQNLLPFNYHYFLTTDPDAENKHPYLKGLYQKIPTTYNGRQYDHLCRIIAK